MIHATVRIDLEVLLGVEHALAYLAQRLIVDDEVSLLQLVQVLLLVEYLHVRHVGSNFRIFLDRHQAIEHVLEVLRQIEITR